MRIIEVIPFHSFKERLQFVKQLIGKGTIIVFDTYIYFERIEGETDD